MLFKKLISIYKIAITINEPLLFKGGGTDIKFIITLLVEAIFNRLFKPEENV